jgi:hypothetical protein
MKTRRGIWWALSIVIAGVLAIAAGAAGAALSGLSGTATVASAPPSTTADAAAKELAAQQQAGRERALTAALDDVAAAEYAPDFAVAVLDHETGASYTYGAGEPFETASVVKVDILATLLLQARDDGRVLTADEQGVANIMIRQSDNDAATKLWGKIGGAAGLNDANNVFGLTETVPGTKGQWGLTTTTVSDQIKLLDVIADPNGPLGDSGQVILNLMGTVVEDQDWGISAATGPAESTALKNGWMTANPPDNRWTVNSVGRITGADTDATVAVMTRGHTTLDQGIAFVENVAELTRTHLAW